MKIKSYENLIVWQKAVDLVIEVYKLTRGFPNEERYGLTIQMRRSAVSIPSNIAEGSRRGTRKDFRNFLLIAYGSGAELETQIIISKRLYFLQEPDYTKIDDMLNQVMRMLNKLIEELS